MGAACKHHDDVNFAHVGGRGIPVGNRYLGPRCGVNLRFFGELFFELDGMDAPTRSDIRLAQKAGDPLLMPLRAS